MYLRARVCPTCSKTKCVAVLSTGSATHHVPSFTHNSFDDIPGLGRMHASTQNSLPHNPLARMFT